VDNFVGNLRSSSRTGWRGQASAHSKPQSSDKKQQQNQQLESTIHKQEGGPKLHDKPMTEVAILGISQVLSPNF
jgi:hypothetical protein